MAETPWSCGLIHHVLDWKVEGSNLATTKNLFQFKWTKISSWKSEQKKRKTRAQIENKPPFFSLLQSYQTAMPSAPMFYLCDLS